ncbi:uncharacterized protein LOC129717383 [Wyeomyia smithii]|uniref:uncharacterized protein LOC129717383 n=1 Tax=Wyeomyia smithii TaxID=174621 RepID=UPI002467C759|nr:uncharacterized protein LOC129717383 [Wyeomyia smithii]
MTFNGKEATTSLDICQLFSKKFASVFTDETLSDHHVERAASYTARSGQALSTIHLDATMISRACSKLKSSLNPGPDGIPSKFLKKQIANLISPLQHVFQLSVTSGIFPSCWKLAYMFPVHKKENKHDVSNYRGITSLCAVAKLFELVIMEPLLAHCKAFISTDQHGFTAGRSNRTLPVAV